MLLLLSCLPKDEPVEPLVITRERSELVVRGTLDERISDVPADLVLFYGGEQRGSLETCGCPERPRGGVARAGAYMDASRAAHPDTASLFVLAGQWLDDTRGPDGGLRGDMAVRNEHMLEGLEELGVDAANVTSRDIAALEGDVPDWGTSASLTGLPSALELQAGEHTVVVVGVGARGTTVSPAPGVIALDPVESAVAALAAHQDADVLVLLSWNVSDQVAAIAQAVPQLDVIIDAGMHRGYWEPVDVGDAVLVRSHYETTRLGEARFRVTDDGVELLVDRKIDLDEGIPDDPELAAIRDRARAAIDARQAELWP
ncbi:MAG: hypothetical protein GY913_26455 [Proteobacteria bacterium]|nr:hypothetical protein [Pseudomonadota bacterium]MCP4920459.1 hypothetical protein [Pseudomonadota bacterium]